MKEMTISIPDEHYEALAQQAAKARRTPEDEVGVMVEERMALFVDLSKRMGELAKAQGSDVGFAYNNLTRRP